MLGQVCRLLVVVLLLCAISPAARAENTVYLLPLECSELLPDNGPFIQFFGAVGRGSLRKDKALSKRIFTVLALRDKMQKTAAESREQNAIDLLIRKTLCFYREKNEPLKTIGFDDPSIVAYLKTSMGDLEKRVDATILQQEIDKAQRKEYERLLSENQEVEDSVKSQAEVAADREFDRLSKEARRKARLK